MQKKLLLLCGVILCLGLLCSCAPGISDRSENTPAGFFLGFWHGLIAPITLIWRLFNHDVRIYEVFNTGWGYEAGFVLGILSVHGGWAFRRNKCC